MPAKSPVWWTAKDARGNLYFRTARPTKGEAIDELIRQLLQTVPILHDLPRPNAMAALRRRGWRIVRCKLIEVP